MDEFILKMGDEVASMRLIERSNRGVADVIVALSGGADSVALLVGLNKLGYRCVAAHCNFHLRGGESDRDMKYAMKIAGIYAVDFEYVHFDVESYKKMHGVSTEMACRDLRYEWFKKLSVQYGGIPVAVGHHQDDNEETFFLNVLRGTGIAGLCGMKRRNGIFVRPLLGTSRNEIVSFLDRHSIRFVTDSTNMENDVKRNRLRNVVFSSIREQFPNADSGILHTISDLNRNYCLYSEAVKVLASRYIDVDGKIDVDRMSSEVDNSTMLLYEIVKEKGFAYNQVCDMMEMPSGSGRRFYSRSHEALLDRGRLVVIPKTDGSQERVEFKIGINNPEVPSPLSIQFVSRHEIVPDRTGNTLYLDASLLDASPMFTLRTWCEGDRIQPFGMRGSRLVSDIMTDAKLSFNDKRRTRILEVNGKILWVVGLRTSCHYAVKEDTASVLCIKNSSQNI